MSQIAKTPFPFQTESCLWAVGRWGEGGTVVIQEGELQAKVVLSAALFDLMAILIVAAQRARDGPSWVPAGFLTVDELREEITRRAGGTMSLPLADPEHVIKAIYRLRKRIGKALLPKEEGKRYAKLLLEKTNLGYRLSTALDNLHLVILGGQELEGGSPAGAGVDR